MRKLRAGGRAPGSSLPARGTPFARVVGLALALLPAALAAQTTAPVPRLELALDPAGPVTVGRPLTVTLTLLVPSYLPQPPVWPELQIADAITRPAPGSRRPVTRRIEGASWAGVTRSYRITPQRAADYAFPDAQVTVTYADPATNAPVGLDLPLPPIAFTAVVPAAAAGLDPFVAADALTLALQVEGPGAGAAPGASVTVRLVTEAQGTQAMLLPALLGGPPVPPGLRAYPRQPELEDRPGEGGAPDMARRIEAVTYVVEMPGDYVLPAVTLGWWNAAAGRVETARAGPATFSLPRPPGWQPPPSAEDLARRRRVLWGLAALAAALLAGGWVLGPRLTAWLGARRARRARSEPVLHSRLLHLARRGDLAAIRPALAAWCASADLTAPPGVEAALSRAERTLWGPDGAADVPAAARTALVEALQDARAAASGRGRTQASPLPPLNPFGQGAKIDRDHAT